MLVQIMYFPYWLKIKRGENGATEISSILGKEVAVSSGGTFEANAEEIKKLSGAGITVKAISE